MKIEGMVTGLGNPGRQYEKTRHNLGFRAIALLGSPLNHSKKFKADYFYYHNLIVLKPRTFMNLSGEAVAGCSSFFKINEENIVVVYDDLDLEFGKIRIRRGGSSGGHRGVESIIKTLGSDNFIRVKIGISNEFRNRKKAEDFVLEKFTAEEEKLIPKILEKTVTEIKEIAENNFVFEPKTIKIK